MSIQGPDTGEQFEHLKAKNEQFDTPSADILEVFESPPNLGEVFYRSDEVTALCPITGQPDYYHVEIMLYDNSNCLESKSLKLYLGSYRSHGGFGEALACQIAEDVAQAIKPGGVRVVVEQKSRGGISIESTSSRFMTEAP